MAVALAPLCGCSIDRPNVRASEARIVASSGAATELEVAIELKNSGTDEIELVEYDYVLTLADGASYGGRWAALRALPPQQTVVATLPAVVPTASVRGGSAAWTLSGTLRYRDPQSIARILYEAGLLKTQVSFSGSGSAIARPSSADK